jgi:mRNA-degrading endonuclease HigB of HigAB toxin-antitoxin module
MTSPNISSIGKLLYAQAEQTDITEPTKVVVPQKISEYLGKILKNSQEKTKYINPTEALIGDLNSTNPEVDLTPAQLKKREEFMRVGPEHAKKLKELYNNCKKDSLNIYEQIKKVVPQIDTLIDPKLWGLSGKTINESISENYVKKMPLGGSTQEIRKTKREDLANKTILKLEEQKISPTQRFLLLIYLISNIIIFILFK